MASTQDLGQYSPPVRQNGVRLNANEPLIVATGGTVTLPATTTIGGSSVSALGVITSASAQALAVGLNGATNPAFNVDSSTGSQAAGFNVVGAVTGGTVAVAAIDSGSATKLSVNAKGSGTLLLGNTSTGQVSIGRGAVKPPVLSATVTALGTAQNTTPTAAQLVGGVITQVSATGAGTCTLDNGTNISTAVPGVVVGDSFQCIYANLSGGQTVTITGATGSTVIGGAAVASGKAATMTFVNTGSNAWNVYTVVGT